VIEETAQVVEMGEGFVLVETQRRSTCGSCAVNKGCGTAVLSKVLGRYRTRIKALNTLSLTIGDEVVIGIRENALLLGSLAIYMIPLLTMLLTGFLGERLAMNAGITADWPGILAGITGLILGFVWVKKFSNRISTDSDYQPVVLRKIL